MPHISLWIATFGPCERVAVEVLLEMLVGKIKLGLARQEDLEAMLGRKKGSSLENHLAAFAKALGRKENTENYNNQTMSIS